MPTLVKTKRFLLPIVVLTLLIATGPGCTSTPTATSITTPTIEDIVATVSPAVVRVIAQKTMGSGMIIDKEGYILTNSHVVKDVVSVKIELSSGEQIAGSVHY
jgi:S1-C subfamily serine protease